MPISTAAVREALRISGGNVCAAAENLGLSRRGLYDRLRAFEINPGEYRKEVAAMPPAPRVAKDELVTALAATNGNVAQAADDLGISRQAVYKKAELLNVDYAEFRKDAPTATALSFDDLADAVRDRAKRRPVQTPRLKSDQVVAVQRLRRQLQAMLNRDLTNSDVLELFFRRYFPVFEAEVLGKIEPEK